jgi:ComF family protein
MVRADPPRCEVCWKPEIDDWCDAPDGLRPAFKGTRAAFSYFGPARDAVLALKFRGISAIAKTMAVPMAERLVAWDPPVSAIVPVPLASSRRRARGYNQSELFAKEIGRFTGLPVVTNAVVRPHATPPQVGQPDWEARRSNVAAAFAPGRRRIEGGVLLVDDVITTGATLDACARVLHSAGSGPVFALTFARED